MELQDGVAVLTLDGGDGLNLFSGATAAALGEALATCAGDDAVRVVVLTGAGNAFCAGADLAAGSAAFVERDATFSASPVQPAPLQIPKLVIAAINGHAIGIGLTLALQCDLRLVAEGAKLAVPQVRRGMLGDAGSHHTLRHLAGTAVAAEILLTGRVFTATEAVGWGIASRALAGDEVLRAALEIARDVAVNASPAALALSKRILWADLSLAETEVRETEAHHLLMQHPDAAEGPAAWRERRAPQWTYPVSGLPPAK
jgi:enoyl-CoA hydratase/carnithine racemase